jgi:ribosome modulation factor
MTEPHPIYRQGYDYRYEQGPLPRAKQQPPKGSLDEVRLWAQGWQQADEDRTAGLPHRWAPPEPPQVEPEEQEDETDGPIPASNADEPWSDGLPADAPWPEREDAPTQGGSLWLKATIHRAGRGYVVDIDGRISSVNEASSEANAAKMLGLLVGEIGKRMAREQTETVLAEIHEKTKGAP